MMLISRLILTFVFHIGLNTCCHDTAAVQLSKEKFSVTFTFIMIFDVNRSVTLF